MGLPHFSAPSDLLEDYTPFSGCGPETMLIQEVALVNICFLVCNYHVFIIFICLVVSVKADTE